MDRFELRTLLAGMDLPKGSAEAPFARQMLDLLDATPDCFARTDFPAHFTGSALVVSADCQQVLLHHHRKLNRWMQFGGHCERDANILEVAHREALEESGIKGLRETSGSPFDLDIHEIPARPETGEPAHFHYDVRFLFLAPEAARFTTSDESLQLRWFTAAEWPALALSSGLRRILEKWENLRASARC
jgi:8-oxo-dGTP pyrophosphatase MutT (NUDIX family)